MARVDRIPAMSINAKPEQVCRELSLSYKVFSLRPEEKMIEK
jgi:hypothetical protein